MKAPTEIAQPDSQTAGIAQAAKDANLAEAQAAAAGAHQDAGAVAAALGDEYKDNLRGDRREKQAKLDKKFNPEKARRAHMWISQIVNGNGITAGFESQLKEYVSKIMHDDLMNGFVLMKAFEQIFPDVVESMGKKMWKPKRKTKNAYMARGQISTFIEASKKAGVPDAQVFDVQDLYEGKNMNAVINHLYALNALAMKRGFKYQIVGGHGMSEANKREWTEEQLKAQREANSTPLLCQTKDVSTGSGMDSYGIVKSTAKATGAVPKLAAGVPQQEAGAGFDSYGIVKSTAKASGVAPKLATGIPQQEAGATQDSIIRGVASMCSSKAGVE